MNFFISIALSKIICKRFPKIELKEKIATNFVTIQPAFLYEFVKPAGGGDEIILKKRSYDCR